VLLLSLPKLASRTDHGVARSLDAGRLPRRPCDALRSGACHLHGPGRLFALLTPSTPVRIRLTPSFACALPADTSLLHHAVPSVEGGSFFPQKSPTSGKAHPRLVSLGGDHTIVLPILRSLHSVWGPISVMCDPSFASLLIETCD
jgi:hypothetical protein